MIELVLFGSAIGGPLAPVLFIWGFLPLVVPILLAVRMISGQGSVSLTSCWAATLCALPYALPPAWVGNLLIFTAFLVVLICPPISLWALLNPSKEGSSKKLVWLLLAPYLILLILRIAVPGRLVFG